MPKVGPRTSAWTPWTGGDTRPFMLKIGRLDASWHSHSLDFGLPMSVGKSALDSQSRAAAQALRTPKDGRGAALCTPKGGAAGFDLGVQKIVLQCFFQ